MQKISIIDILSNHSSYQEYDDDENLKDVYMINTVVATNCNTSIEIRKSNNSKYNGKESVYKQSISIIHGFKHNSIAFRYQECWH